jgi:hypothetical protein
VAQPGRSRNSAGRHAQHLGIRTHLNLKGDPVAKEVIASETVIVPDDALGIERMVIAGQPVPPDLVDAYQKKVGGSKADESSSGYAAQKVEDLQAEVDRRELTVEGTGKDGNVVKADLVTALEDSDASAAVE